MLNVHAAACDCGASIVLWQLEPSYFISNSILKNESLLQLDHTRSTARLCITGQDTVIIGDLGTEEIQHSTWPASNCPEIRHMG